MLFMTLCGIIGIFIGSFFVWKRKLSLFLSVLLNSIMTVILFVIGLYIDVKIYYATPGDHTGGAVYSYLLFFGIIPVFVFSILVFLTLRLIQFILTKTNNGIKMSQKHHSNK